MDGPKLKNDWMDHVSTKVRIFNFYEVKLFRVQTNWWICGKHFAVIILKIYLILRKNQKKFLKYDQRQRFFKMDMLAKDGLYLCKSQILKLLF